jgi:hypothetical protein
MFPLTSLYQFYYGLPGWLTAVLGLVFLAVQILLMIDCLRNQRDMYWLWILWVFPVFGALAYYFYFRWSGSSLEYFLFRRSRDASHLEQLRIAAEQIGNAGNHEELGDELWRQRKYTAAEPEYRKALAKDPTLLDSRARLGYCLLGQGKPNEARPFIESVLAEKRGHDHEHLLWQAARCQRALGDLSKARELYEEYLRRHSYFEPQVELAEMLAGIGEKDEAQRICKEVITDVRNSPSYIRRRQGQFAGKAKRLLRRIG